MCDHQHFDALRGRVDTLEDSVKEYHAKTDVKIEMLFASSPLRPLRSLR